MKMPEGWPTEEMIYAAFLAMPRGEIIVSHSDVSRAIKAMLEAAPTPPAQEDEPVYQARLYGAEKLTIGREPLWLDVTYDEYVEDTHEGIRQTRILYTRPKSDNLRKAAEKALYIFDIWMKRVNYPNQPLKSEQRIIDNLRNALKK